MASHMVTVLGFMYLSFESDRARRTDEDAWKHLIASLLAPISTTS